MSQCWWEGGELSEVKDGTLLSLSVLWVVSVYEENSDRKKKLSSLEFFSILPYLQVLLYKPFRIKVYISTQEAYISNLPTWE